jgi:type I restriction enzyme, S subunit
VSVVLSEHLPLLASAPDGIQKLRGLILELAVRGKLVPQDTSDEPASELLKRIAKERARLEVEGICKKSKPMPRVGEEEQPFVLPNGWEWQRLDITGQYINGLAFKPSDWGRSGKPIIRIQNLSGRNDEFNYTEKDVSAEYLVARGDILVSWSATLDAFIWDRDVTGVLNQHIFRVVPSEEISRAYLFWLLRAVIREMADSEKAHGLVMKHINRGPFLSHVIALPPINEQHRIVAKVDELMALCDRLEAEQADAASAHARLVETLLGTLTQSTDAADLAANWQRLAKHFDALFSTEASIDALKQTLLQLAVMGKLVPQDPNDEPAGELLKRIDEERSLLVSRGKLRKSSTAEYSLCDRYDSLPAGWLCTDIGSVAFVVTDGTHKTPKYCLSGVKFVSAKDIRNGRLSFDDCKFISLEEHADLVRRCKPEFGDILVSKSGSIGTVVRVAVQEEFSLFESLALIKFSNQQIDGDYLALAIRNACNTLQEGDVKGVAVKHLHLNVIRSLNLALPPLTEQHRIVAKVDELMALSDRLKADLTSSRQRQATLANTVIESALEAA